MSRLGERRYEAHSGLRVRDIEDGALVFHPVSWDVHLLNPVAMAVLESFIERASTSSELVTRLEEQLEGASADQVREWACQAVDELIVLGLIRADPADADR